MLSLNAPYPFFADIDGDPLDDGYIYVGLVDQNPETAPVAAYWDEALTQPAEQPLRTSNGYIVRNGTPARVYVSGDDFSMTAKRPNGVVIFYAPSVSAISTLRNDLADDTSATSGSGMVGFSWAVPYSSGSIGYAIQHFDFYRLTNKPTTLPGYGITDAASILDLKSVRDQLTSLNASTISYSDNASFTETWANLTAWTLAGTPGLQVNSNRAYSTNQGAGSGANHSYATGNSGRFREVAQIVYPATAGSSGGIIVGVSTDTAGSAPTSGAGAAYGIYSRVDNVVLSWAAGVSAIPSGAGIAAAGAHTITVAGDENYVSAVLRKNDGATESRARWLRSSINVQNLYCFNSDTRQLTGMAIGGLGAKQAQATVSPRAGIEDQGASVMWTAAGNASFRVALPNTYDSRIPSKLAICFHGNGSDENHFADNANGKVVANALLDAGYIVLSCANSPNTSTWGSQAGLDAYVTAYNYVKARFAIGPVVFYANSMGSIESLLTLADSRIPGVVAWCGTSPTFSLLNNYNHINGGFQFRATINTAYGITGVVPNDYATLTAGHDPALMIGYSFRRVPMKVIVATDDVDVPKSENADLLQAAISPYATVNVTSTTGGHSFDFTPFAASIVSFFDGYAK